MTQASAAEWELAIALPLGAVASQLQRIEAQLRLLNMKALDFARDRENRTVHGRSRLDSSKSAKRCFRRRACVGY